jgi:predicted TIM-barrel fold metal-dependent hydrolase
MNPDLVYFDAFTRYGPRPKKHLAHAWRLDDVLSEMDHCSISAAMVATSWSVFHDAMEANLRLSAEIAPHPHLFPVWNVMPHHSGDFPAPRELDPLLRRHNVRAVILHPKSNGWDWQAPHSRELFRWLARRRLLTVIFREELAQPADLERFLEMNPSLPVLFMSAGWNDQRLLLPMLPRRKNLHLGLDRFQIHYGPERFVKMGCEDRILYASNAPLMCMGAHRAFIDWAEIPLAARRKMAGGNLARLLGVKPPRPRENRSEDRLMAAARSGKPLPAPVVDFHMHILPEGCRGGLEHVRMENGGPTGAFHQLARTGCVGGGFMSWRVAAYDSWGGNEDVRRCLDAAPPGYWGLASVDPLYYTQDELARMIPEVYRDRRFVGMKPYVRYGIEYHHPSYDVWWKFGNRHQLYALIHRCRGDYAEVDALAKKYPRVRWVVAHCGADYRSAELGVECARRHPNVYLEITYTAVTYGIIDYLVKGAGADRVLYGSDLPMRDLRPQLGWVVFSRLPEADKRKVLASNAMTVLAPCLARLPARNRPNLGKHR